MLELDTLTLTKYVLLSIIGLVNNSFARSISGLKIHLLLFIILKNFLFKHKIKSENDINTPGDIQIRNEITTQKITLNINLFIPIDFG